MNNENWQFKNAKFQNISKENLAFRSQLLPMSIKKDFILYWIYI